MTRISHVVRDNLEISKEKRKKILQEFHEQPIVGHLGMKSTFD